ncbi:MAG TPA: hypothetical protein VM735_09630 [Candidatus Kapabacteria bacterium]|nr:hypothetical protein [Candidatus Kapabacteria bacterium]
MENPTGFDVKRATDQWRQSLQHLSLSDADIAEVETHFIDSMTALEARGLSPEESFLVAKHRIGPAERIDREFRKIKPDLLWLRRACWIVFGALLAPAVSAIATICVNLITIVLSIYITDGKVLGLLGGSVQTVMFFGLFALVIRFSASRIATIKQRNAAIFGAIGLLIIIYVVNMAVHLLAVSFLGPVGIGNLAIWGSYFGLISGMILPLAFVLMLRRVAVAR